MENKAACAEQDGRVPAVVIGGNGALGKALVKSLLNDGGYKVHVLDLGIPKETNRNEGVCSYIQTDITNPEDLTTALKGAEVVFHTASLVPAVIHSEQDYHRVNVGGTENVIKACGKLGVKRLIYTSSIAVLVNKDPSQVLDGADETTPCTDDPADAYSSSKSAAEKSVRSMNGKDGLVTCALRPTGILGSPAYELYLTRRAIILGDGCAETSFVPVGALARAHVLAEKKLREGGVRSVAAGKAYILSTEEKIPFRDLCGFGAKETTIWGHPPPRSIPMWLCVPLLYLNQYTYALMGKAPFGIQATPMGLNYYKTTTFTSALARKELGWEEIPPWRECIREVVKEHKERIGEK